MADPLPPVPFATLDREHAAVAAELREAFERVVGRSAFILGAEVERFETAWAGECGAAHCVGTASGTSALTLMLLAAGIGTGDEVIVPAHTYIASALAVVHAGAVPVLCDVDESTGLIDPESAAAAVGPRSCAVLAVHLYGQVCKVEALQDLCDRHGLALFEDAAQAHGAQRGGRTAGGLGAAAAFSFYPSKNLGALGDGGAICTSDAWLAERARRLRHLGQRGRHDHVLAGYNERLDGLQAAFLAAKLPGLRAANDARRALARRYRERLPHLATLPDAPGCVHHVLAVRVPDRDAVRERVRGLGVAAEVHYPLPLHRQAALAGRVEALLPLDRAEAWAAEELSLPMGPALRPDELDRAADACLAAIGEPVHA